MPRLASPKWVKVVPNAPCGVESIGIYSNPGQAKFVPNAPCGVESSLF